MRKGGRVYRKMGRKLLLIAGAVFESVESRAAVCLFAEERELGGLVPSSVA